MEEEKYFISVSEPWDFESLDGNNIIGGNVLAMKNDKYLVFKSNHYLQFGKIKGNILILTPRHNGYDFSNYQNEIIAFNGSILLIDYNELLNENVLIENSQFIIIGSIRKV
jgi:hypothetical protein